jgi:hypothetical protein
MRELEDLDRRLDLARLGLSSTPDARTRVRRGLSTRGAFSPARSLATPRHRVPKLVSAALMGISFAAGYGLRHIQPSEIRGAPAGVVAPAAPLVSSPAPSPSGERASVLVPEPSAAPATARLEPNRARAEGGAPLERRPSSVSEGRPAAHGLGSASAAGGATTTSGELALLRRVERALRTGDPALALILLDQLERAYPVSALGEERTAARILVDCARSGELAKPEAARFLEKHPSSVYSDRILRACHLEANGEPGSSTDVFSGGH